MERNLTTGGVFKNIVYFSLPYLLSYFLQTLYGMADLFITGINAVTMEGTLHWLDMVGNRIAPVAFGPRKVVLVAGSNKIVANREEAEERIRRIAAPQNIARHEGFRTPCAKTGVCMDCNSPDRICNTRMEMLRCHPKGRIHIILIDKDLGL